MKIGDILWVNLKPMTTFRVRIGDIVGFCGRLSLIAAGRFRRDVCHLWALREGSQLRLRTPYDMKPSHGLANALKKVPVQKLSCDSRHLKGT